MNKYLQRLIQEDLNLIILHNEETLYTSSEEGMLPLYTAITQLNHPRRDLIVVDKIMGKAAALLVSCLHAKEVHCITLSKRGKEALEKRRIPHYYETLTPEIVNRYGNDICPFEKAVLDVEEPENAYIRIQTKLKALGLLKDT